MSDNIVVIYKIVCCHYIHQAERIRVETQLQHVNNQRTTELQQTRAQLQQKDAQIQQNEIELRRARIQFEQNTRQPTSEFQHKSTELNSVQQSLQVST